MIFVNTMIGRGFDEVYEVLRKEILREEILNEVKGKTTRSNDSRNRTH